jgi:hypothetical protein
MLCRRGVSGGCFAAEVVFPADALSLRSLTFPADALLPRSSGGCFAAEVVGISGRCFAIEVAGVDWTDALSSGVLADALPLLSLWLLSLLATMVLSLLY